MKIKDGLSWGRERLIIVVRSNGKDQSAVIDVAGAVLVPVVITWIHFFTPSRPMISAVLHERMPPVEQMVTVRLSLVRRKLHVIFAGVLKGFYEKPLGIQSNDITVGKS